MNIELHREMVAAAREFVHGIVDYSFSEREQQALKPFFSNHDRRIFFMTALPESVAVTLLAMYSRLKNPRGLRGHFVDHMVPMLLCSQVRRSSRYASMTWQEASKQFKDRGLTTLDKVCESDFNLRKEFRKFISAAPRPEYWTAIAQSARIRDFKNLHVEKYGDKSIKRPARLLVCLEDITIMLAKYVEDTTPDCGRIELSSRFVSFTGKTQYPIWRELELIDRTIARMARENVDYTFQEYQRLVGGEKFDGPLPTFLRERWSGIVPPDGFESAIQGESCDVAGNLLPNTTLTQVGLGISGEMMSEQILKTLYLEGTPEAIAVAEFLVSESQRCGYEYFIHRYEPTPWDQAGHMYMSLTKSGAEFIAQSSENVAYHVMQDFDHGGREFQKYLEHLKGVARSPYEALPERFRGISVTYQGTMSFRSWRDAQRQSMSIHRRSRVTPLVGFYRYPKPAPPELAQVFARIHNMNEDLYMGMKDAKVPEAMAEYPMAMGNLVHYRITSDLKWAEFNSWQRTKWGVNDEVRSEFLKVEGLLRAQYPWWAQLSRADMTPHYVFGRGKGPIVLPSE